MKSSSRHKFTRFIWLSFVACVAFAGCASGAMDAPSSSGQAGTSASGTLPGFSGSATTAGSADGRTTAGFGGDHSGASTSGGTTQAAAGGASGVGGGGSTSSNNTLEVYPAPSGLAASDLYAVTVIQDGQRLPSFVYKTTPKPNKSYSDADGGDEFRQGMTSNGAPARSFSWTSFAFTGTVTIEVKLLSRTFKSAVIRPTAAGVTTQQIDANTAQFTIANPGAKLSFEVDSNVFNNQVKDALLIFADVPEPAGTVLAPSTQGTFVAQPGTVVVPSSATGVYFGPGVYELGRWHLPKSVTQVYLAGGAFVYGSLDVDGRPQFSLTGRGVLSGDHFVWRANRDSLQHTAGASEANCWTDCMKLVELWSVDKALIDGVTLLESPYYYLYPQGSTKLDMHRFKILGSWTWNTDGPEITDGGTADDCFAQTNDDMFKLYHGSATVQRCVTWHMHNGGMFQMGWTTHTFSNVQVSSIDAIHAEWVWSANHNVGVINHTDDPSGVFKPTGAGTINNVSFSDIRVEGTVLRAVGLYAFAGMTLSNFSINNLSVEKFGGDISPVMAEQNEVTGTGGGRVQNVAFKSFTVGGTLITQENAASIGKMVIDTGSTSGITFSQ